MSSTGCHSASLGFSGEGSEDPKADSCFCVDVPGTCTRHKRSVGASIAVRGRMGPRAQATEYSVFEGRSGGFDKGIPAGH